MSVVSAIKDTIPISMFNKGLAGKIFNQVKKDGTKVVMKNNTAECVLLSPEEYIRLINAVNDAKLLMLAQERLKKNDGSKTVSYEDMNSILGIAAEDVADYEGVEFE